MEQALRIMAEPQFDYQQCKFVIEKPLFEGGGSYTFNSAEEALGSPLAEALFALSGVIKLFISTDSILVTKNSPEDWRVLGKEIGTTIRNVVSQNKPLISDSAKSKLPRPEDLKIRVTEIINEKVNPSVASHGGYVELIEIKVNDVYLKMGGGCQGCSSASATVKQGIEQILRKEIPHLGAVIDVTDHASGTNPYFRNL